MTSAPGGFSLPDGVPEAGGASGRPCPCGSGRPYGRCCGRVHAGAAAATAEDLMRARYSAHVVGDEIFLLASWLPSTRPARVALDRGTRWEGLEVLAVDGGGDGDDRGTVEFRARFRQAGRGGVLHERSRFVREDGRWCYVDGQALAGSVTRPGSRPRSR